MTSGAPDFWLKGKYIELIDTINAINSIVSLGTIDTITKIELLKTVQIANILGLVVNAGFEYGDLTGWSIKYGNATVETVDTLAPHTGTYFCKLHSDPTLRSAIEYLFPNSIATERIKSMGIWVFHNGDIAGEYFRVYAYYTDGTYDYVSTLVPKLEYTFCDVASALDADKRVAYFRAQNFNKAVDYAVDDFECVIVNEFYQEAERPRLSAYQHDPITWSSADSELDGGDDSSLSVSADYGGLLDIVIHIYKSAGAPDWSAITIRLVGISVAQYDITSLLTLLGSEEKSGTPIDFTHIDAANEDYTILFRGIEIQGALTIEIANGSAAGNKVKQRTFIHKRLPQM